MDGKTFIRNFDPSTSCGPLQLKNWYPIRLLLGENGVIFVVDSCSDGERIIQVHSQLTDHAVILSKGQHLLDQVTRLCYVPEKQQLILGQGLPTRKTGAFISVVRLL